MTLHTIKLIADQSSDIARYEPLLRALKGYGLPADRPKGNLRLPSNPKRALADMQAELKRGRG